jgi:hypothetical protein
MPGRSSVIRDELQAGGKSIMFMFDWISLVAPRQETLDSLRTFSSSVLNRLSRAKSRKEAVIVALVN